MSLSDRDAKQLELLGKIADALVETFNPEEPLVYTPLYRIAHALEMIAKQMDPSFKPEQGIE
jgi:hypothetical protein|tara:strand:- start:244 stop:429 length:186 start_codon:yes stop_codon:yes gene_type:complete